MFIILKTILRKAWYKPKSTISGLGFTVRTLIEGPSRLLGWRSVNPFSSWIISLLVRSTMKQQPMLMNLKQKKNRDHFKLLLVLLVIIIVGHGIRLILNYSLEKKPDVPAATKYSLSRFGDKIQVSYYQNPSQKPMNHRKILTISQGKCNFVFVCLQLRAFCF